MCHPLLFPWGSVLRLGGSVLVSGLGIFCRCTSSGLDIRHTMCPESLVLSSYMSSLDWGSLVAGLWYRLGGSGSGPWWRQLGYRAGGSELG